MTQGTQGSTYTVIGYWGADDEPYAVGVIEGDHAVSGGDSVPYQSWATCVDAKDVSRAERIALAIMRE